MQISKKFKGDGPFLDGINVTIRRIIFMMLMTNFPLKMVHIILSVCVHMTGEAGGYRKGDHYKN